ncbi:MAG TPA: hypothetical protein VFD70_18790, partial [Anaerolineae bacterium]|nr:hypothetical protein [Anaerolineae bacterium]
MKTPIQVRSPRLALRTHLHAGGLCKPHDTNCVSVNEQGQKVFPYFDTCNSGFPGAGAACIGMLQAVAGNVDPLFGR